MQAAPFTPMMLPVGKLTIDTTYQRHTDEAHLNKLIKNWVDNYSGCLEVNHRNDDVYAVFDGGHRTKAAKTRFGDDHMLLCKVFSGLTVEEEADLFTELNKIRKPIKVIDLAKSGMKAEDPQWLQIANALNSFQLVWSVEGRVSGDRAINCWAALRGAHSHGGVAMVEQTLRLLTSIWNGDPTSLEGVWVSGMADFIRGYSWSSHFDEKRIIERLSAYKVEDVVTRHGFHRAGGVPVSRAYRKTFQEFYNKGLRSGKLLSKAEAED